MMVQHFKFRQVSDISHSPKLKIAKYLNYEVIEYAKKDSGLLGAVVYVVFPVWMLEEYNTSRAFDQYKQ